MGFLCVLKKYHVRLYIVEKMEFGMAHRQCGIRSKPYLLLQKTYISYAFETLAIYVGTCLCTNALTHVRKPRPTHVGQGLLWSILFPKIDFFFLIKKVIFSILTLLKSI